MGKPILISISKNEDIVILCSRGLIVVTDNQESSIKYEDIEELVSAPLNKHQPKSEMDHIDLLLKDGTNQKLVSEKGEAFFLVWNILLMLVRMS